MIDDARITVESGEGIEPGGSGLVRLHPLHPPYWEQVRPGMRITMQEASRVVGHAEVLRVVPARSLVANGEGPP